MTDARLPLAVRIMRANPHAYEALVVAGPTPALARELLQNVQPDHLLAPAVASSSTNQAILAGLWLWHDGLQECHEITQKPSDIASTMALWHAIMHRREGDFSNSKYWYSRAARHAALASMAMKVGPLIAEMPADPSLVRIVIRGFDPNAFVDLVEEIHGTPDDQRHRAAIRLQQLEWRTLFDQLR